MSSSPYFAPLKHRLEIQNNLKYEKFALSRALKLTDTLSSKNNPLLVYVDVETCYIILDDDRR